MKLKEIYRFVVEKGMELDPRGKEEVRKVLKKARGQLENLREGEKEEFDQESLTNPYADTRILYGDGNCQVRRILAGIDLEIGEVLVAKALGDEGKRIDLLLAHHPEGRALAGFYDVMHMQADILHKHGVPINVAEGLLEGRIKEVERKVMPLNHSRAVDAARIFDIPFICVHTPADNRVTSYLGKMFGKKDYYTLGDIIKKLKAIPEYKEAMKNKAGPKILIGAKEKRAGKIFVDMTGGTEGSKNIFEKLADAGVGTIIGMHMGEEHWKEAEKHHINVIIAGHIASDSIGLNLMLDDLMGKEKMEIIPCSGFIRVERKK